MGIEHIFEIKSCPGPGNTGSPQLSLTSAESQATPEDKQKFLKKQKRTIKPPLTMTLYDVTALKMLVGSSSASKDGHSRKERAPLDPEFGLICPQCGIVTCTLSQFINNYISATNKCSKYMLETESVTC